MQQPLDLHIVDVKTDIAWIMDPLDKDKETYKDFICICVCGYARVAPGFKDKTRYTPYVCPGIQFTHIVINEGVISKTMPLLHSV